jgi:hypothetical protein
VITIAEVIEQCAKIIDQQDVDPSFKHRMSSHIRALAAQYEGWIAVDTLRDTPTLDAAMDSARKYLAELDAPETCKPALQVERADPRRPLTDEEIEVLNELRLTRQQFARAIERAHKIGGNDD